jgi:hypothetical protein
MAWREPDALAPAGMFQKYFWPLKNRGPEARHAENGD